MKIVLFIVISIIAGVICKIINQNTIGTTGAYVKRYIIVWFITGVILLSIFGGT